MFKFGFDVDHSQPQAEPEDDEELLLSKLVNLGIKETNNKEQHVITAEAKPAECRDYTLDQLISLLPESVAYSFQPIPGTNINLPRRELFDIRLQLLSQEGEPASHQNEPHKESESKELEYADNPSDLIPSVYEGGLKTWECSLDLAAYLYASNVQAGKTLELGCGSSLPSLFVFHQHLARGSLEPLEIHLQDYNDPILHLVVLPNFILTWYFSPAADEYRASHSANVEKKEEEEDTEDLYLDLTPSLLAAFNRSLSLQGVTLTFTSGPWSSFSPSKEKEKKYDLILTSETIYSASSHRDLIGALKASSEGSKGPLILLSSKTIYFGLPPGGDLATFLATLEGTDLEDGKKGKGEPVWSNDNQSGKGVGRQIIKVSFS